eukprot:g10012.t1 g10012   contig4:1050094-1051890(+)
MECTPTQDRGYAVQPSPPRSSLAATMAASASSTSTSAVVPSATSANEDPVQAPHETTTQQPQPPVIDNSSIMALATAALSAAAASRPALSSQTGHAGDSSQMNCGGDAKAYPGSTSNTAVEDSLKETNACDNEDAPMMKKKRKEKELTDSTGVTGTASSDKPKKKKKISPKIKASEEVDGTTGYPKGAAGPVETNHQESADQLRGQIRETQQQQVNASVNGLANTATSFPRELHDLLRLQDLHGMPEQQIDEQALRDFILKKQIEESNRSSLALKLRNYMRGQEAPPQPQTVESGDSYAAMSNLLKNLPTSMQGNISNLLSQQQSCQQGDQGGVGACLPLTMRQDAPSRLQNLDPVQQAIVQSVLANQAQQCQARDAPAPSPLAMAGGNIPSLNNSSAMSQFVGNRNILDSLTYDVVHRRLQLETMLMSEESRLRQIRENLQTQFISQPLLNHFGGINQLNQFNLQGAHATNSQDMLLERDRAILNEELQKAMLAERLSQSNFGGGGGRSNTAMMLQQALTMQQQQRAHGDTGMGQGITTEMLARTSGGGGYMNNDGLIAFGQGLQQPQQQPSQGDNLGALSQLLGMQMNGNNDTEKI